MTTDLQEFVTHYQGKQVVVSTVKETLNGTLLDAVKDDNGNITGIVIRQYFHRTKVAKEDIINVRLG